VLVEEHLDTVIVHRDPRLLDLLREQYLAPLDDAAPASRLMLRETLRSWLRNMGDRAAMAEELHVHAKPCATGWVGSASRSGPRCRTPTSEPVSCWSWPGTRPPNPDPARRPSPESGPARRPLTHS